MKPRKGKLGEACWYCWMVDDNLLFSQEWDAPFHEQCIRDQLNKNPRHEEALITAREFGMMEKCGDCGVNFFPKEQLELCVDCQMNEDFEN